MKSPNELAEKLVKQWRNSDCRVQRFLSDTIWPIQLVIGKPSAKMIRDHYVEVKKHLLCWENIHAGEVIYQKVNYQSLSQPLDVPIYWLIHNKKEWIAACADKEVTTEYKKLQRLLDAIDKQYHPLLISQTRLWRDRESREVIKAADLVQQLEPKCAQGLPLRALAYAGIDSKFFERHRSLLLALLDIRFQNLPSKLGLNVFLGAQSDNNHWLLVADLAGNLLPFNQIRVRDSELFKKPLPGKNVIIVENERCLHQLPPLPNTLALLGAGLNLAWMKADWLVDKHIAYWGDIDSWGLTMLARARQSQPHLQALLMDMGIFLDYATTKAVVEPQPANERPVDGLTEQESKLYCYLLQVTHNRLEQEFLPIERVNKVINDWFLALET